MTPAAPDSPQEDLSFEDRLARLEGVVEALEGGELPLEESIERYQEGVGHLKECLAVLDAARKRIEELTEAGAAEAADDAS